MNKRLMKLPKEIKNLVNQGIYSLYSIANSKPENFVLAVSPEETYLLDRDGEIIKERCGSLKAFKVIAPITFPDIDDGQALTVNGL